MGEDLLLLAVSPRDGRIRAVEGIGFALLAVELVDLTVAGRITVADGRITLADPTPIGHPRLDLAMALLNGPQHPLALDAWLQQRPHGPGIINQYMTLLADQGGIRIERRGEGAAVRTRIVLLDRERFARTRTRIDNVAHSGQAATTVDRALAAVIHACGLDRYLYRGLRGRAARRRLANLTDHPQITAATRATADAADVAMADAVARTLSDGSTKLTRELTWLIRQQYRIDAIQHTTEHSTDGRHHDRSQGHHTDHGVIDGGHHHSG